MEVVVIMVEDIIAKAIGMVGGIMVVTGMAAVAGIKVAGTTVPGITDIPGGLIMMRIHGVTGMAGDLATTGITITHEDIGTIITTGIIGITTMVTGITTTDIVAKLT
jgi:hypothetical protein